MSERDTPTYTEGSEGQSGGMNENVDFVLHSLDIVWDGMFSTIKKWKQIEQLGLASKSMVQICNVWFLYSLYLVQKSFKIVTDVVEEYN